MATFKPFRRPNRRARRAAAFWAIASIVFGGLLASAAMTGRFTAIERTLSNYLYLRPNAEAPGNVVIVAIDDRTLDARPASEIGTLRLPKADYATVIRNLRAAGAAAIGVDVILSEASTPADVNALRDELAKADDVVLAGRPVDASTSSLMPLEELQAARVGSVLFRPDPDGTVRRQELTFQDPHARVAFPIAVIDVFFAQPSISDRWNENEEYIVTGEARRVGVARVDPVIVPTADNAMLINFFSPPGSVTRISFVDARDGKLVDASGNAVDVRGKIVLIGEDATALHDEHTVPVSFGHPMAGVEIHANSLETMLSGSYLTEPSRPVVATLAFFWFAIALGAFILLSTTTAIVAFVVACIVHIILGWVAFAYGIVADTVYPYVALALAFGLAYAYRSVNEASMGKEIAAAFSRYVSPHVVGELMENPDRLKLGGDKREMTVLFSDIAGFTSIAEALDADDLVEQLNEYLDAVSEVILQHDGTIDKFIGDAVMAFWNAPLAQADHATLACRAALAYQMRLRDLNASRIERGLIPFEARIGLNAGPMIVGNVGSRRRFDYTVIGDAVNLASRLEGANKAYGTNLIVSEAVLSQTGGSFEAREMDLIAVKGKDQPVRIYELLGERGTVSENIRKAALFFGEGLTAYRATRWDDAVRFFNEALRVRPDDAPSKVFLARIAELRNHKDIVAGWDGVYRAKEK